MMMNLTQFSNHLSIYSMGIHIRAVAYLKLVDSTIKIRFHYRFVFHKPILSVLIHYGDKPEVKASIDFSTKNRKIRDSLTWTLL